MNRSSPHDAASDSRSMKPPPLSREAARTVDRLAIDELGLPGIVLMENAAINATAVLLDLVENRLERPIQGLPTAIACGAGHNGGDGFAIARHLSLWGADVRIACPRPVADLTGDAGTNARVCAAMGLPIDAEPPDEMWSAELVVDAMLGTGFAGDAVREPLAGWIEAINRGRAGLVVSIDTPSGLDSDTGTPAPTTVAADATVTFVDAKRGLLAQGADRWVGELIVAEIGVPDALVDRARAFAADAPASPTPPA
ncbi:MAG: NAD(P)H-hydrate epimerase [Planctomycetota bacterium]